MKQFNNKKQSKYMIRLGMMLGVSTLFSISALALNTFNVNYTTDVNAVNLTTGSDGSGHISLRGALQAAENLGGTSIINVPAGTYHLTKGYIEFGDISDNITIIGTSSATTIIDGGNLDRIFAIDFATGDQSSVNATIKNITFQNGQESDGYGGGAIWAGGPSNTLTISNCVFKSNISTDLSGGAIDIGGFGGTVSIDSSSFISNSTQTGSGGGAIDYELYTSGGLVENGSLTVTNSTFTSNTVTSNQDGGAIFVSSAGGTGSFSLSIHNNSFVSNGAPGTGKGGAIYIELAQPGQTSAVNYNRFYTNTSGASPSTLDVNSTNSTGVTNASDNWWGSNAAPGTTVVSSNSYISLSDWITFTRTVTPTSVCTDAASDTSFITTSFLTTHSNNTLTTANISSLVGVPISFGSALDGSIVNAPTVINPTGLDSVDFVANSAPNGGFAMTVDGQLLSTGNIDITAVSLPNSNLSITQNTGTTGNEYLSSCQLLDKLVPSGASPVSGSVTSKVWVESSVPNVGGVPFVARHYQIEPAIAPASSSGTITLYFKQSEFTAFNADPSNPLPLPTGPGDAAGISNLRVAKYEGVSGDGSGMPATYSGSASIIDPADANIVWDATNSRWAVTFDVTSFSGLIIQTDADVIAVKLVNFTASLTSNNSATINWDVTNQTGVKSYLVEKSTDGTSFDEISSVAANDFDSYNYSYIDNKLQPGTSYYRLETIDEEGKVTLSPVTKVTVQTNQDLAVYPDPVTDKFFIKQLSNTLVNTVQVTDINGSVLQTIQLTLPLQQVDISSYAPGIYILHFSDGSVYRIIKD
jgi:type IX secretion system substrate protein